MLQLYANNAKTTLASAITSTQTTITVSAGTGSLFPTPVTGVSWFTVTLTSATNPANYEICLCTFRSGDTLTIIRGQEGTTAQPFNLNDIVGNYDTAYVMENLVQADQWQDNYYGLATAGGTVNALTATIPSNFTTIPNGLQIVVFASGANTGPATLQLTLGSTVTAALPIIKGNNSPLIAGDIPLAGYPLTLIYSSTLNSWVLTDIAVNLSPYATLLSPAFTGTPTAPTPAINNNSTEIATTAYVQNNLANYAPIYQPNLTGTPTVNGNAIVSQNNGGWNIYSNYAIGTGQSWHNVTGSRSNNTVYTNNNSRPIQVNVCVNLSGGADGYTFYVEGVAVGAFYASGYVGNQTCSAIVPPGGSYQLVSQINNITFWSELY
jgi:hypothetical protein